MTDSLFLNRLKPLSDNFLGADTTEESIVTQPINSGKLETTAELPTSVFKTKQTVPSSEVILDESSVIEKLSEQQTLNTDLENGIAEAVVLKNRTSDPEADLPKVTQVVNETLPNKSSDTLVEKVLSSKVLSKEVAPTEIIQAPIIEKIEGSDKQQVPTVIEEVPETAKKTAAILDKSIPVDQEISEPEATNRVEVQSEKQSIPVENENVEPTDQVHSTTKTESTDKSITPKSVGNSEIVTSPSTTIPVREAGTIALDVPKIQSGHGPTLEKVVQEIAKPIQQELQTMVRPNEKVVTFDLDPGDLGKIQVKMKVTAQSVSLELTVQSEQTKKMFEAITTRLDKVLQKQENVSVFTVTRSEPTIASTTDNQNSLSQSFQQGFSQERPMQQQRHPAGRYRKQQLEENVVEHEVESRVSILA
jgi:flagellar hook-length control protein FliK